MFIIRIGFYVDVWLAVGQLPPQGSGSRETGAPHMNTSKMSGESLRKKLSYRKLIYDDDLKKKHVKKFKNVYFSISCRLCDMSGAYQKINYFSR
jgi:hypothetical protein